MALRVLQCLAGYIRRRELALAKAVDLLFATQARMAQCEHAVAGASVLALLPSCRCTAYDLEFLTVAKDLGAALVTNDQEILRAFPRLARPLATYA